MTDSTHYIGDGCQPEHVWPAPVKPPDKVRHSWRCSRQSPVVETLKRLHNDQALVVSKCTGCDGTDVDARLVDRLLPDDGGRDAA